MEVNIVWCFELVIVEWMIECIEVIGCEGDFCGGVIECVVCYFVIGLGMLVFDKFEVDFVKVVMLLLVIKGFEIGFGFDGMLLKGSEYNDVFVLSDDGWLKIVINNFGGI